MCRQLTSPIAVAIAFVLFVQSFSASAATTTQPSADPDSNSDAARYAQMDLESLMQVEVGTATITRTEKHLTPAAITFIDRDAIDDANPRSLLELLDVYVPNEHWEYAMWEPTHLGIRGIISDREDKDLLLVNGRVMNERTHEGAFTERDLSMLGDIEKVDVVRGPGSATYGPGAMSGVISIQTYSGLTFQGTEVTARGGGPENFLSADIKHGQLLSSTTGLFLYAGVDKYEGAGRAYTPLIQGLDFPSHYGPVEHGQPVPFPNTPENGAYRAEPRVKLHAQLDTPDLSVWVRFTKGGQDLTINERAFYAPGEFGWGGAGFPEVEDSFEYFQATAFVGYKHRINDKLAIDLSSSIDDTDLELRNPNIASNGLNFSQLVNSDSEIKWYNRALVHWDVTHNQQLAVGVEDGYFWFGQPSWVTGEAVNLRWGSFNGNLPTAQTAPMPQWTSNLLSFIAEYQWRISDHWTLFLSGRADKHTFTDWMYSPRGAVAFSPTMRDTFKLIASQSVRTNFEEEMKYLHDTTGQQSRPETMKTLEFRYERQQDAHLFLAGSVFYNNLNALGWDDNSASYRPLGKFRTVGAEFEASYRTDKWRITASHGLVKLVNAQVDPGVSTLITAANHGYGYDLANWPSQITKLTVHRDITRRWSVDSSLRIEWGFPGDQDFLDYRNANPPNGPGTPPASVPGWNEPYGINAFLDLGAQYDFNEHATLRLDAYNVLGWVNRTLNKGEFLGGDFQGEYRVIAPTVALSFKYRF
jgi:iron complex outermembrane receptor protein